MSDPTAETPEPAPRAESWGCTVGIAIGLALIGSLVAGLATKRAAPVDGAVQLSAWFAAPGGGEGAAVPSGFEIADAVQLDDGQRMVQLSLVDAADGTFAPEEAEPSGADGPQPENRDLESGDDDEPEKAVAPKRIARIARVDWSRIPLGEEGTAPFELLFVEYPLDGAPAKLRELFRPREGGDDSRYKKIHELGNGGGRVFLRKDVVPWGKYAAVFVHERQFRAGPTFQDAMIVNLARGQLPLVLFATWPEGMPASQDKLAEILAGLPSRDVEPD